MKKTERPVVGPLSVIPLIDAVVDSIVMDLQSCTVRAEKAESERDALLSGIKALYLSYVNTIETARDFLIEFKYPCDPVDVMEKQNPALTAARELIKKIEG